MWTIVPVGKIAKKQSEGVRFLLIRHSKYSNILAILPTAQRSIRENNKNL